MLSRLVLTFLSLDQKFEVVLRHRLILWLIFRRITHSEVHVLIFKLLLDFVELKLLLSNWFHLLTGRIQVRGILLV